MADVSRRTRGDMLVDLADSIRELCEPRTHSEYLEAVVVETVTARNGRMRVRRTKQRKRHVVVLPGLLEALTEAAVPGSGDLAGAVGGFESRPSAELEPLSVLREITDDCGFWSRTFAVEREGLSANLSALVSAPHDDAQLRLIVSQAARWVRRARLATGFDPAPRTLGDPCPYCLRRNALIVTGDLTAARCQRCGTEWDPDTIGLLAEMLTANQTVEVLALAPCWQPDCTQYGNHTTHGDGRGRTWADSCPVSA